MSMFKTHYSAVRRFRYRFCPCAHIVLNNPESWNWDMIIYGNNPDGRMPINNPSQAEEDEWRDALNTPDPEF